MRSQSGQFCSRWPTFKKEVLIITTTKWLIPTVPGFKKIKLEADLSIRGGTGFSLQQLAFHVVAKGILAPNQDFKEIT